MRERSTWDRNKIKKAADTAGDIYTMNQEHPQPAFDKYVTGDPSDFAEDVHSPNTWETEYSGEEVKRNEIGMPEMRGDTFNHSEKTASRDVLLKKANLCVEVATMMLAGKRVASESMIEDQAYSLMFLPAQELIDTHTRLAQQQDEDEEEMEMGDDEQQQKQAGDEMPEFIKEKIEEKEEGGEKKEAGQVPDALKEHQFKSEDGGDKADAKDEGEKKQAQDQSDEEPAQEAQQQQKQATQMMAQMQQMMAQLQQMMQQAQGQQQAPMMADQGMDDLDQMLAQDSCGPMAESDIQMDPSGMDMMASEEDEILKSIFASDEEVEEVQEAQQQKQAKAVRTASTRTVGTRPSEGVAKLGGGIAKQAGSSDVDQLSSLWATAPDVSSVFK